MSKSNATAGQQRVPEKGKNGEILPFVENLARFLQSKSFYYPLIIVVLTFLSFLPALKGGFMQSWDDEKYVTANPMVRELNVGTVRQMFTKQVNGSYVPLPMLSFSIEYKLFGDSPVPFHVDNLLLHILCTLLVFSILRALKIDLLYAVFGALLFGIHPMRVESVSWISERKDVLYGFFYLSSLFAYIRYITGVNPKQKYLLFSILLFLCSLLSKIEAVMLPVSLLLVDFLLQRPARWKLITEKIPYFLLSLLFGLLGVFIIYRVGLHTPGFIKTDPAPGFGNRLFLGCYSITGYLFKFLVPYAQSAMYPYPVMSGFTAVWIRIINPVVLIVLAVFAYRSLRKTRVVVFGLLFFLANIFFLLQIVAVGNTFFADRYTYIPYIGLIFIVVWFMQEMVRRKKGIEPVLVALFAVFATACFVLTFSRSSDWEDGVSLWTNVIEQYPQRMMEPYVNRGISHTLKHEWGSALEDYNTAISIGPETSGIYADRGIVYGFTGQPEKAAGDFSKAISLDPKNTKALFNRGVTYGNAGQAGPAIADFRKVLELEPASVSACAGLGIMLFEQKQFDTCILLAERGLRSDPYRTELYALLGNCLLETGKTGQALEAFRHCLRLDDTSLDAYLGLGAALFINGDLDNALRNLDLARQAAAQKNIRLNDADDMEKAGITLHDRKKAALQELLHHKH